MTKACGLPRTNFGRHLSWGQWIRNANLLLEYWQAGHAEDYPQALWYKWWSSGLWVSTAVHKAMNKEI